MATAPEPPAPGEGGGGGTGRAGGRVVTRMYRRGGGRQVTAQARRAASALRMHLLRLPVSQAGAGERNRGGRAGE